MRRLWLLYDARDLRVNADFAAMMARLGEARGLLITPVTTEALTLGFTEAGEPFCLRDGRDDRPDAVFSRQRNARISQHLERLDIPVFNNSRVCALCNDKRATHAFLQGLPMPHTLTDFALDAPPFLPAVLKPACSHGGDRVTLVSTQAEWTQAVQRIAPEPMLCQRVVSDAGRDLRVYVVNERIVAGVMRSAKAGIVSNFKQGGDVRLHPLTEEERALATAVIARFHQANAPLCMAGVDLLYQNGHPVVGEVEDVVGSRMLYQTSDVDIAAMYLDELKKQI